MLLVIDIFYIWSHPLPGSAWAGGKLVELAEQLGNHGKLNIKIETSVLCPFFHVLLK